MVEARRDKNSSRKVTRDAHWIEWMTGLVCAVVVATMMVWIVYDAMNKSAGAPELHTKIINQKAVANGFEVSFTIENRGSRAAAAVPVTGVLKDGDQAIEENGLTFDYIPAQSHATGAFLFRTDPSLYRLEIYASGYVDP